MPTDWEKWNNNDYFNGPGFLEKDCPSKPTFPQVRQILKNESNLDLRNIYFNIVLIDGHTPALDENGLQPEINMSVTGWSSNDISPLVSIGFGRYYATLTSNAVNNIGVILSRYIGIITLECFGESIEVIDNYRQSNIFNEGDSPTLLAYVTLSEAEKYFAARFKSKAWECAETNDKLKTLVAATQDIDKLAFSGVKTSEYRHRMREFYIPGDQDDIYLGLSWVRYNPGPRDFNWDDKRCSPNPSHDNFNNVRDRDLTVNPWYQELQFPRNGDKIVPVAIKQATCEIAYQYLNGFNFELEIQSLGVIHQSFSSTRDSFDRRFAQEHIRAGINSAKAWIYLKPFLRDPKHLRIARTS
jgi:hypothetical protein